MLYNKEWDRPQINPIADLLNRAANLIETRGHTKYELVSRSGAMCFMGALNEAMGSRHIHKGFEDAALATCKLLGISKGDGFRDIDVVINWNNAPERTGQEVIDVMRQTAHNLVKENA